MQQKITFSEACNLIASRTGVPRKVVDEFLRAMFATIADTLSSGEQVRVKGIGSFKVATTAERKSVDVRTGNVITLPSHTKLTFIPAKELALAVNSPFSAFEAVELSSDLPEATLLELAGNESPAIAESGKEDRVVNPMPKEVISEPEIETEQEEKLIASQSHSEENRNGSDSFVSESDEVNETAPLAPFLTTSAVTEDSVEALYIEEKTPSVNEIAEKEPEANDIIINTEPQEFPIIEEQRYSPPGENQIAGEIEEEPPKAPMRHRSNYVRINRKRKRFAFVIGFLCALLSISIIGILIILLCPSTANTIRTTFSGPEKLPVETPIVNDSVSNSAASDSIFVHENIAEKDSVCQPIAANQGREDDVQTKPSDTPKVYDTVTTTRYLSTIARQHYGNQHFWPYIYEENKAILGHPNYIKPGTKVVVPDLKKYGVDPTNKEDIATAKKKGAEIYKRYSKSRK